jgi:hypothetical protein
VREKDTAWSVVGVGWTSSYGELSSTTTFVEGGLPSF